MFVSGNKVWLDAQNLKIKMPFRKLSPWRYGPFEVLQQISPIAYRVQLPKSWQIHNVFHVDLLIPHHKTKAYGTAYSQPPPELINGDEEYEVKEIITHCTYKCKKQYLVKSVGYPVSENSWVFEADLHAPELLVDYQCSLA
jgi:hypothetical protein